MIVKTSDKNDTTRLLDIQELITDHKTKILISDKYRVMLYYHTIFYINEDNTEKFRNKEIRNERPYI